MNIAVLDYEHLYHQTSLIRMTLQKQEEKYCILEANKSALNYFNTLQDLALGQPIDNFLDDESIDYVIRAMNICEETKVSVSIQLVPQKADKQISVQNFLIEPILDTNGNVILIDIKAVPPTTQTAAIERERDDAISMFTTVFGLSEVGITVTDHHGRFVRINDAFVKQTGWDAIDLIGQEITVIIPEEDHEKAWERHQEAYSNKRQNFGETRILKKDGTLMYAMVTSVIMALSNGRSFRITTVVDITNLKQVERELRAAKDEADKANVAKSAFLANMSHELRTPLNAIIGFSDMMISGTLGQIANRHYQEYLDDIKFSAEHLLQIINDVLDMSKIEAGKMPLLEEPIQLAGLMDSVVRLMQSKAREKSVQINLNNHIDGTIIYGDERLLRQVFLNILSNAIKFSYQDKTIEIFLDAAENDIEIIFKDYGVGIPACRLKEVMEPFGQIDDPRLNKGQGTGLGLPIAKAMMEMHGGQLTVSSVDKQGTTVTCLFPESRIRELHKV